MKACFAVDDIKTPKGFLLRGLWFGPKKPEQLIIWVHGLSSSAFSMLHVVGELADSTTAVMTFNNRGAEKVIDVRKEGKKAKSLRAGSAHEVFTQCVDDIEGAINYARRKGIKNIYLAGHSTGCQKSVYWASKKSGGRGVKGIILLAPVSDYAAAVKFDRGGELARLTKLARKLVREGKKHQLMPSVLSDGSLNDAQRFLSLNTPDSIETTFPYEQKGKRPRVLQAVKKPVLVLWAAEDEYADRPAGEIARWFDQNIKSKHKVVVVPGARHSFSAKGGSASGGKGAEKRVAREIKAFLNA